MNVKQNGMTYDSEDPRCQLFIGATAATRGTTNQLKIAFITVVDDSTQCLKRYFGAFDWEAREDSIRNIMDVGGKWPDAFANKILPEGAELFDRTLAREPHIRLSFGVHQFSDFFSEPVAYHCLQDAD